MMKRITFRLVVRVMLAGIAMAYNGSTTVTKESEGKEGVHFDVSFQEHYGTLYVTVVAPQKVHSLSLSEFAVVQSESNKTTLRVPMASAPWTIASDTNGQHMAIKDMNHAVSFEVSSARLKDTKLEVRYSESAGGMNGWTYIVDLNSYQPKTKGSTTK